MVEIVCLSCLELTRRVADLEQVVAQQQTLIQELKAKVDQNSSNSSIPPSANPLHAPKPVLKKKSKRKPGGQPGHPPHLKQLLPADRVTQIVPYFPERCQDCHAPLPLQAGPNDPEPSRFQVIELPPIVAKVTEHQGHARTCPCCGTLTQAVIPQTIRNHSVGPRLTATLSYFTGCHGVSKRGVEEIADSVFGAPIALGTVANLEQEVSAALAAAHQEALEAVRTAEIKHADETSWKLGGALCWLWGAATASMAVFVIHPRRNKAGLTALLGQDVQGLLCSDRWSVYNRVPAERRQICWAHLKRDFQKIVDRSGSGEHVGRQGLKTVKKVFAAWHTFQDGDFTREQFKAAMEPVIRHMNRILMQGAFGDDARVAKFCENVLVIEPALWTFVEKENVEPTNNHMERMVRLAVLWRKRSFGCWSKEGCRFVERILTVVQTKRLQAESVLEYLHDAVRALRNGQLCPKLLPSG